MVFNIRNRLQKLRGKLAEKEIDAIFITQAENRRYLSSFSGTAGYLIITGQKAVLATDFRYVEQAKAGSPDFEILRITGSPAEWFPSLLSDLGIKTIGFEAGDVTFNFHHQLRDALKKKHTSAKLVPINGLVESLRAVKEPEEIELIRKAAAITDAAFEYVESTIKAGMTENQVAWELEKALREKGSQPLPFDIIVASGTNAAMPHAKPSDRIINEGEPVMIDMGAKYSGYASDLTRTICIGTHDDTFKRVYNAALDAQTAAISKIKKGMTGHQSDSIAREIIQKAGYGEAFGHALGHGVGLAEHELPRLGSGSDEPLTEGMVFTIEPGIYLSGWGGVRIEDTVVMENGRVKQITRASKMKFY
jgi:Xaa-Pro aminopeptidase